MLQHHVGEIIIPSCPSPFYNYLQKDNAVENWPHQQSHGLHLHKQVWFSSFLSYKRAWIFPQVDSQNLISHWTWASEEANEDLQLPPAPKYFVFLERFTSSQQLCAAEENPFRTEFFTSKASGVRPSPLYTPQLCAAGIYFSWFPAAFTFS